MDELVRITQAVSWQEDLMLKLIGEMKKNNLTIEDFKLLIKDNDLVSYMVNAVIDHLLILVIVPSDFIKLRKGMQLFHTRRTTRASEVRKSMNFFGFEPATPDDVPGAYSTTKEPFNVIVLDEKDKITMFNGLQRCIDGPSTYHHRCNADSGGNTFLLGKAIT